MSKFLWAISAIAMMFFSSPSDCPASLKENIMFEAYNNGYQIEMKEENVKEVDRLLCQALQDCRPMPALGVSLHDDTIKAVEKGIWLRFAFGEKQEINGLGFDQLLFRVNKDMYGISIARGCDGKFEGRDFYIDIHHNLDDLYLYLSKLAVNDNKFSASVDEVKQTSFEDATLKIKEVAKLNTTIPAVNKDKDKNNSVIEGFGKYPNAANIDDVEDNSHPEKIVYNAEQVLLQSIDF